jgi:predicted enzyme related to lactoylglutathione lyase
MNVTRISLQLASENPQRLAAFYRDVVQLPAQPEFGDHAFALGPAGTLFVVDHSQVAGPTREPARAIIDLHLEGLDDEQARLEAAGVSFARSKGVEYWGGVISTFDDPDGNLVQIMEFRPELARPEGEAAAVA